MQFSIKEPTEEIHLLSDIPAWSLVRLKEEYLLVTDLYTNDFINYSASSLANSRLCLINCGIRTSLNKNTKVVLVADKYKVLLTIKE